MVTALAAAGATPKASRRPARASRTPARASRRQTRASRQEIRLPATTRLADARHLWQTLGHHARVPAFDAPRPGRGPPDRPGRRPPGFQPGRGPGSAVRVRGHARAARGVRERRRGGTRVRRADRGRPASLRLLAGDPAAPPRRVVLAAEIPAEQVSSTPETTSPAAVLIAAPSRSRGWSRPTRTTPTRGRTSAPRPTRCPPPTPATRTPSSPWTGPKVTSSAGTPARSWPTWPNSPLKGHARQGSCNDTGIRPDPNRTPGAIVMDAVSRTPVPVNEPVRQYQPGSHERAALEAKIKELAGQQTELTMTIAGRQDARRRASQPWSSRTTTRHVLGHLGNADDLDVAAAIHAAKQAAPGWRALSFDDRAAVFLKAADLLAGPWRATRERRHRPRPVQVAVPGRDRRGLRADRLLALQRVLRQEILCEQPDSAPGTWNRMEYRPLEGFVLAITPFNFTSIAGNLPTAPALLGNVVVWKPSPTQQLSAHYLMRLLEAAGLPPGVINLVTGDGQAVSRVALSAPGPGRHPLHRLHRHVPAPVADRRREHRPVPQLPAAGRRDRRQGLRDRPPVRGPSLDRPTLIRGAFEYQGQKCSAASRAYLPRRSGSRSRTTSTPRSRSLTLRRRV